MLKKICIFLTLLFFIGLSGYLSGTYYYKIKMIDSHKEYYEEISKNLPKTVSLLENKKLERQNENIFIENIHFYNLTNECMDYYGVESIEDYRKIQKAIFKKSSLRNNYKLRKLFENKKKEFIKAFSDESFSIIKEK